MSILKYNYHEISQCSFCGYHVNNSKILGKRLNLSKGRIPRKKIGITTTIMLCKNCGLIFSNPIPIPQQIEDHYGLPAEEYWK